MAVVLTDFPQTVACNLLPYGGHGFWEQMQGNPLPAYVDPAWMTVGFGETGWQLPVNPGGHLLSESIQSTSPVTSWDPVTPPVNAVGMWPIDDGDTLSAESAQFRIHFTPPEGNLIGFRIDTWWAPFTGIQFFSNGAVNGTPSGGGDLGLNWAGITTEGYINGTGAYYPGATGTGINAASITPGVENILALWVNRPFPQLCYGGTFFDPTLGFSTDTCPMTLMFTDGAWFGWLFQAIYSSPISENPPEVVNPSFVGGWNWAYGDLPSASHLLRTTGPAYTTLAIGWDGTPGGPTAPATPSTTWSDERGIAGTPDAPPHTGSVPYMSFNVNDESIGEHLAQTAQSPAQGFNAQWNSISWALVRVSAANGYGADWNFFLDLCPDLSGVPDRSATIASSTIAAADADPAGHLSFQFSPQGLAPGTNYWLVLRVTGTPTSLEGFGGGLPNPVAIRAFGWGCNGPPPEGVTPVPYGYASQGYQTLRTQWTDAVWHEVLVTPNDGCEITDSAVVWDMAIGGEGLFIVTSDDMLSCPPNGMGTAGRRDPNIDSMPFTRPVVGWSADGPPVNFPGWSSPHWNPIGGFMGTDGTPQLIILAGDSASPTSASWGVVPGSQLLPSFPWPWPVQGDIRFTGVVGLNGGSPINSMAVGSPGGPTFGVFQGATDDPEGVLGQPGVGGVSVYYYTFVQMITPDGDFTGPTVLTPAGTTMPPQYEMFLAYPGSFQGNGETYAVNNFDTNERYPDGAGGFIGSGGWAGLNISSYHFNITNQWITFSPPPGQTFYFYIEDYGTAGLIQTSATFTLNPGESMTYSASVPADSYNYSIVYFQGAVTDPPGSASQPFFNQFVFYSDIDPAVTPANPPSTNTQPVSITIDPIGNAHVFWVDRDPYGNGGAFPSTNNFDGGQLYHCVIQPDGSVGPSNTWDQLYSDTPYSDALFTYGPNFDCNACAHPTGALFAYYNSYGMVQFAIFSTDGVSPPVVQQAPQLQNSDLAQRTTRPGRMLVPIVKSTNAYLFVQDGLGVSVAKYGVVSTDEATGATTSAWSGLAPWSTDPQIPGDTATGDPFNDHPYWQHGIQVANVSLNDQLALVIDYRQWKFFYWFADVDFVYPPGPPPPPIPNVQVVFSDVNQGGFSVVATVDDSGNPVIPTANTWSQFAEPMGHGGEPPDPGGINVTAIATPYYQMPDTLEIVRTGIVYAIAASSNVLSYSSMFGQPGTWVQSPLPFPDGVTADANGVVWPAPVIYSPDFYACLTTVTQDTSVDPPVSVNNNVLYLLNSVDNDPVHNGIWVSPNSGVTWTRIVAFTHGPPNDPGTIWGGGHLGLGNQLIFWAQKIDSDAWTGAQPATDTWAFNAAAANGSSQVTWATFPFTQVASGDGWCPLPSRFIIRALPDDSAFFICDFFTDAGAADGRPQGILWRISPPDPLNPVPGANIFDARPPDLFVPWDFLPVDPSTWIAIGNGRLTLEDGSQTIDANIQVYRTTDGGATWNVVFNIAADQGLAQNGGTPDSYFYVSAPNPGNFAEIYLAAAATADLQQLIYVSKDGGASWHGVQNLADQQNADGTYSVRNPAGFSSNTLYAGAAPIVAARAFHNIIG